ncbi:cytochrome c oxidase assembly protein [Rhodobacterales bacterium HKCCE4037]|nr:cytochrome c oxidase assembly protein [Rhodobacterales bacterium HKCCE4037]
MNTVAEPFWNTVYCGPAPNPAQLWQSWNLDPVVLLVLAGLAWHLRSSRPGRWAVVALFVAFVSPLCALSSALFSARIVHHVLLIAVAAPLLALVWPARTTTQRAVPLTVSAIVLWVWHLPAAYDLALSNVAVYWLMQISLLASAVWFWRSVLAPDCTTVDAISFIILGYAQMGMLGAILTFAPDPFYAAHMIAPLQWGITPLADQQLGGLIMWGPAGLASAIVAIMVARNAWADLRRAGT